MAAFVKAIVGSRKIPRVKLEYYVFVTFANISSKVDTV